MWRKLYAEADSEDMPRKLSYREIQHILSRVKELPSPFTKAASVAHSNLLDHLGTSLEEIRLCPSAIDALADRISASQMNSVCEPGYAMGSTTGSALGSINTQTMLNTFKSSGAADTGSREVEATENLVYARPSPKSDYCNIHFRDKRIGMYEALVRTYEVDKFTMRDALTKTDIDYVVHDLPLDEDPPPWFSTTQTETFSDLLDKASCIMELVLDPVKLAVRDVAMSDVVISLQNSGMSVTWSSLSEGRVFLLPRLGVHVNEEQLMDKTLLTCFMVKVIYDNLDKMYLKGIPGQSNSEPVMVKIPTFVTQSIKLGEDDLDYADAAMSSSWYSNAGGTVFSTEGYALHDWTSTLAREEMNATVDELSTWKLSVNSHNLLIHGLSVERIVECLANCSITDVRLAKNRDWSSNSHEECKPMKNEALLVRSKRCPLDLMNSCMRDLQENRVNPNSFVYVYIKSQGINLNTICLLPFVDTFTSTCVNAHVMRKLFGIANSMMSHVHTVQNTFDFSNQSFHPCRVQMMCDHITCTGNFHGVDHTGMAKREAGFLTQASLERSSGIFIKHSLGGAVESVDSISPATILGGTPRLGTGLNNVVYRVTEEGPDLEDEEIIVQSKTFLREKSIITPATVTLLDPWIPEGLETPQVVESAIGLTTGVDPSDGIYRATSPPLQPGLSAGSQRENLNPLAASQEQLNIVPEQFTPGMVDANQVLENSLLQNARENEVAPEVVLRNLASGSERTNVTGAPELDSGGVQPYEYHQMEELHGVINRLPGSVGEEERVQDRHYERARSLSLSDSEGDTTDDHLRVVAMEEQPQSLYGNQEAGGDVASCGDPASMNVVDCYVDSEEGASEVSFPGLEEAEEGEEFYGNFVPFGYSAPISEIVKELKESRI